MQKIQLSIPEPCHENWQTMTPTEQGRFCSFCSKEVIDFSMMTDAELLNYLSNHSKEKVCGRVLESQLNRPVSMPKTPKKRLFWYWNYIMMFLLLFSKSGYAKAVEKHRVTATPVKNESDKEAGTDLLNFLNQDTRIINGEVVDENGSAVPFATVRVFGAHTGLSADANGRFSIRVSKGDRLEVFSSDFYKVSIETGDLKYLKITLQRLPNSTLEKEVVVFVGAISTGYSEFGESGAYDNPFKNIAVLKVMDSANGKPLDKATITITRARSSDTMVVSTNKKGIYKLKKIGTYDGFYVKVTAPGYAGNEFTIEGTQFENRKESWNVFLSPEKHLQVAVETNNAVVTAPLNIRRKSDDLVYSCTEQTQPAIRMGAVTKIIQKPGPLILLDGKVVNNPDTINMDDLANIEVLKGPSAIAVYGYRADEGVIIMTSKKATEAKSKNLDTVTVKGYQSQRKESMMMGAMVTGVTISSGQQQKKQTQQEAAATKTLIFPNPVKRGTDFTLQLQGNETGAYSYSIINPAGQVVLQRQGVIAQPLQNENILCVNSWAAGIYYVVVRDGKGQLTQNSSFIVQ